MPEQIYAIPINDAFDRYDGCPLCRLRADLDKSGLEFALGESVMEPGVRAETNRYGFCARHFDELFGMRNMLGLALLLKSHLDEAESTLKSPERKRGLFTGADGRDAGRAALDIAGGCSVCRRTEEFERKYCSNVVFLWRTDTRFREKYRKQPYFCLEHFGRLAETAKSELGCAKYEEFLRETLELEKKCLNGLRAGLAKFTESFDYRNIGAPAGEERTAVARSIEFLTGTRNK